MGVFMSDQDKSLQILDQFKLLVTQLIADQSALSGQEIHRPIEISVEENNIKIKILHDITIELDGELEVFSNGQKITFDSVGSEIHINSRAGKSLKNLPESKKYIQDILNQQQQQREILEHQHSTLVEVLSELEEKILGTKRVKKDCQLKIIDK